MRLAILLLAVCFGNAAAQNDDLQVIERSTATHIRLKYLGTSTAALDFRESGDRSANAAPRDGQRVEAIRDALSLPTARTWFCSASDDAPSCYANARYVVFVANPVVAKGVARVRATIYDRKTKGNRAFVRTFEIMLEQRGRAWVVTRDKLVTIS